ncbi:MAG: MFS transporter [bacterium]|nr:MFS transporter [bacterium]
MNSVGRQQQKFSHNIGRIPKIYKNKNFLLLIQGGIVSNLGNSVRGIAITWFILTSAGMKNSGLVLALFSICWIVPNIALSPMSGVLVDRINRKFIIVSTDVFSGIFVLILAYLTYIDFMPLTSLMIITVFCSALSTLFEPAVSAVIPNIVHKNNLMKANSIQQMGNRIAMVAGAAIAGFLYYKFGIVGVFIIDGVTFILSGSSELFIRLPKSKSKNRPAREKKSFKKDVLDGLGYLKKDKPIFTLFIFAIILNFCYAPLGTILIPKAIKFSLGLNAAYLGTVEAFFSLGIIAGTILLLFISKRRNLNYHKLMINSLLLGAFIILFFGVSILPFVKHRVSSVHIFMFYSAISLLLMLLNSFVNVPLFTIFQKRVPDSFMGRFFALLTTFCLSMIPLANAIFGYFSDFMSLYLLMFILGGVQIVVIIFLALSKQVKKLYVETL